MIIGRPETPHNRPPPARRAMQPQQPARSTNLQRVPRSPRTRLPFVTRITPSGATEARGNSSCVDREDECLAQAPAKRLAESGRARRRALGRQGACQDRGGFPANPCPAPFITQHTSPATDPDDLTLAGFRKNDRTGPPAITITPGRPLKAPSSAMRASCSKTR